MNSVSCRQETTGQFLHAPLLWAFGWVNPLAAVLLIAGVASVSLTMQQGVQP